MDRDKKLRKYKRTPMFIVEDHNEVVPYIHRAIAGRYLPFSDLVFVHFDSHPDLLIPKDLQADDIFNREVLYESTSIENWILPMVFGGHIKDILWIKPPWCSQISDKTIEFYVGKCRTTGTLRCSCKENYFVSETLYRPVSQLIDKKLVTLTVFTIIPKHWTEVQQSSQKKDYSRKRKSSCDLLRLAQTDGITDQYQHSLFEESNKKDNEEVSSSKVCCGSSQDHQEASKVNCSGHQYDAGTVTSQCLDDCLPSMTSYGSEKTKIEKKIHCDNMQKSGEKSTEVYKHARTTTYKSPSLLCSKACKIDKEGESGSGSFEVSNCTVPETENESPLLFKSSVENEQGQSCGASNANESFQSLHIISDILEKFRDRHMVLDVDLDFFSTKNPFLEMYETPQYNLLQQLYSYEPPASDSDQDIENCVKKRETALAKLKKELLKFESSDDPEIEHPKKDVIHCLVDGVKRTHEALGKPVDFELLHEAGCTCDDTELPHHVSTEEQIALLVDATQDFLCRMKTPTIITIARSSNDDYCPPDQVDTIQESVLEILRDLYLEIDVVADY